MTRRRPPDPCPRTSVGAGAADPSPMLLAQPNKFARNLLFSLTARIKQPILGEQTHLLGFIPIPHTRSERHREKIELLTACVNWRSAGPWRSGSVAASHV